MKKTLLKCLPLAGLLLLNGFSYAQNYLLPNNKVWVFGKKAGVDFNGSIPAPIQTSVEGSEAFASVADHKGNLQFYTNGSVIWNSNHDTMLNGYLWQFPTADAPTYSAAQGALITSKPGNINQYYVFSLGTGGFLSYSVVDMTLENGLGAVIDSLKNIPLATGLAEKLTAVQGDSCNLWLATRSSTENSFKCFNISSVGIDTTPVVSNVGSLGTSAFSYGIGNLKFSHDGTKAALAGSWVTFVPVPPLMHGFFELYNFNRVTGTFSNPQQLGSTFAAQLALGRFAAYDVEFSPDGTKLYTSGSHGIRQFDLTQVTASPVTLATIQNTGIELATDGRIYFKGSNSSSQYLSCISNPNSLGTAAGVIDSIITFDTASRFERGLVNTSVILIPYDTVSITSDTLICGEIDSFITIQPSYNSSNTINFLWDNGDTTKNRNVTTAGTYWIRYQDQCSIYFDTIEVINSNLFTAITVNGFTLGTTGGPYVSYQWYLNGNIIPGATGSSYTVTQNGSYQVGITDDKGCSYLSENYSVNNYGLSVNNNTDIAKSIKLFPNPAQDILYINSPISVTISILGIDGRLIKQHKNATAISLFHLNKGIYFAMVTDQNGQLIKTEKIIKK